MRERDPIWTVTDAAGSCLGNARAPSAEAAIERVCRGASRDGTERAERFKRPFTSRVDIANGGAVHAADIDPSIGDSTACGRWVGGRRARHVPVWLSPVFAVTCGACLRVLESLGPFEDEVASAP